MKNKIDHFTMEKRWNLTFFADVAVALSALLCFFMALEHVAFSYPALFTVFMSIALYIDWRDRPHPDRRLINVMALTVLLTIFLRMRRNYVIEALMEALLLMIAVKMLEKKTARDYTQITGLGLGMLICYAMLSADKAFIVYCFGMGLVLTLSLILTTWLKLQPSARLSMSEFRQLCGRSLAIFGLMLPVCLVLFFVVPRTRVPLFGFRGALASSAATGFSGEVHLGDVGNIQTSNKLAFRVEMPSLDGRTPYWRGMVLDFFDGYSWVASGGRGADRSPYIPEEGAERVTQHVFLEPTLGTQRHLFALDQPFSIEGISVRNTGDGIFRYQSRDRDYLKKLQYTAVSILSNRMCPANPSFDPSRSLRLPEGFLPRLRQVVEEMTAGMTDREKVDAVMSYLSPPEFEYTLEDLPMRRDALAQFIFEGKKGNCEYFASAMGVMLRMAEVPARLVAGYRGGNYSEVGGYYAVNEGSAHVWVEFWDEIDGAWVRRDPTPMNDAALNTGGFGFWEEYMDLFDYKWSQFVVNYNWEAQGEFFRELKNILRNPRASLAPTGSGLRSIGTALAAPAAVIIGLIACVGFLRFLLSLRKRRPEAVLLGSFLRAMRERGYVKEPDEGLEEFLDRVADSRLKACALPFVREFENFYYRDIPLDAEAAAHLKSLVEALEKEQGEQRKGDGRDGG